MESFTQNAMSALLTTHRTISLLLLGTLALLVIVYVWREKFGYFLMNLRYSLPMAGRISRFAKSDSLRPVKDGWLQTEDRLCRDFLSYYNKDKDKYSPEYFEKCSDYLGKVQEHGRRERGLFLWTLIIGMIFCEAVGFAYVLAPFMVQNVSANTANLLAWFTAFLLSVAAVIFTEMAGRELHEIKLFKIAREWWNPQRDPKFGKTEGLNITINNTYSDDDQSDAKKLINRLPAIANSEKPKHTWTAICLAYIIAIAIGAFVVRDFNLKKIETELINNPDAYGQMFQGNNEKLPDQTFELPSESSAQNATADEKTGVDKMSATRAGSLTTYVILSIIFVAIQGVGILLAYRFSFAGRESAEAWEKTRHFSNSEEYAAHYRNRREQIASDAQAKLSALQQQLGHRTTHTAEQVECLAKFSDRTFYNYLAKQIDEARATDSQLNQRRQEQNQQIADNILREKPTSSYTARSAESVEIRADESVSSNEAFEPKGKIDPEKFTDLTDLDDEFLETLAIRKNLTLAELKKIQKQQALLKQDFNI